MYYEVLPTNVAHLLLDHAWLYDNVVKYYGRNNTYKFTHEKKTVLLRSAKLVTRPIAKSYARNTPTQRL